jgi:hypothetical protein
LVDQLIWKTTSFGLIQMPMPTGLAHVLLRWKIWACLDLKPTVAEAFVQRCEIKKKRASFYALKDQEG